MNVKIQSFSEILVGVAVGITVKNETDIMFCIRITIKMGFRGKLQKDFRKKINKIKKSF